MELRVHIEHVVVHDLGSLEPAELAGAVHAALTAEPPPQPGPLSVPAQIGASVADHVRAATAAGGEPA